MSLAENDGKEMNVFYVLLDMKENSVLNSIEISRNNLCWSSDEFWKLKKNLLENHLKNQANFIKTILNLNK